MRSVEQLAQATDPLRVRVAGAIRRFVVSLASGGRWQVAGVKMPAGQETHKAEVFGGIGFHARPSAGVQAEAIALMVGDATTPVIVGLRDEKTRAAIAGALGLDETAMYNTVAILLIKSDTTIEARSAAGVAVSLATKADLQAVVDYVNKQFHHTLGHVHATPSGSTTGITEGSGGGGAAGSAPSPNGTTVFKAE